MADARRRQFDVVMVLRFDRLSRSVRHSLQVIEELRGTSVALYSHEQSLDTTTPMGQFTLTMFAALAELKRSAIRERVVAGREYVRRNGTKSGRPIGRPRVSLDGSRVATLREQACPGVKSGRNWELVRALLSERSMLAQNPLYWNRRKYLILRGRQQESPKGNVFGPKSSPELQIRE